MDRAPTTPLDKVKITFTIPLEQYNRMQRLLAQAGVIRNRFLTDAIEDKIVAVNPEFSRAGFAARAKS
jgi:hypothetical protein